MNNVQFQGYTLLEVLIVITVSASMFVVVAVSFGGRQQQVQFTQAVRDFDSQLNNFFNDVSAGYYPQNYNNKICRAVGVSNKRPQFVNGTADLGTNSDCVNIGKVIQFSPEKGDTINSNGQYIDIFNVAGLRTDGEGKNPLTIEDSVPRADPDSQSLLLRWGLKVTKVAYAASPSVEYGAIGIFSSLGRSSSLEASDSNEDVRVNIIPGTTLNMVSADMVDEIDETQDKIESGSVSFNTSPEIIICLSDSDENRRAIVGISGNSASGTYLEFEETSVCNP